MRYPVTVSVTPKEGKKFTFYAKDAAELKEKLSILGLNADAVFEPENKEYNTYSPTILDNENILGFSVEATFSDAEMLIRAFEAKQKQKQKRSEFWPYK